MPFVTIRVARFAISCLLTLCLALVVAAVLAERGRAQAPDRAQGIAAFESIAEVLRHPRCLNCHQEDAPLQGEAGRAHLPRVVRGEDNLGVSALRCTNCHQEMNNAASRVPGAPHWSLAPASMTWEGLPTLDICLMLKDPKLNGGRSLDELVTHMGGDPLVLWGWAPGGSLEPVGVAHAEFMDLMRLWAAAGGPCPD